MKILEAPVRWWHCPECELRDRTQKPGVHTQFHNCPALGELVAPLVEVAGPDANATARHRVAMREDYAGTADPRAAVYTDHDDGSNDVIVFDPTATAGVGA